MSYISTMKKKWLLISILSLLFWTDSFSQSSQAMHKYCQNRKFIPKSGGGALDDPGNLRSDTLDVLGYDLNLDFTMMNSAQLKASCAIHFKSKMDNIDAIHLDLITLTVDSVLNDGDLLGFTHVNGLLHVDLPDVLNENDEENIIVYYHGTPGQDATWGGFYFQAGYAYNMGVAFTSEPHNFGRAWFPCFDNFVERSSFTYHVLTNQNRTAYCNGIRLGVESVGQDSLLTHWHLEEQIPSYLASVSVSNYVEVNQSFPSVSGDDIPIVLVAKAIDTTDMKNSMVNLDEWMEAAESRYGPYRWPRVGYCVVPFNGGAMEHSTNISYPLFAVDGTLNWETLYAHEVAHQWWGDLITCRNASDMWINEGWASFSEALFMEMIYGEEAYKEYTRENHKDVLLHAHQNDGARYPVSGVPSEATYGSHTYSKGADMAHTLRGYMGDADFFTAIQAFMQEFAFDDVSSEDMRDFFQNYTSADLTSFFDNWIFEPGFPEFRIQGFSSLGNNVYSVEIEQHQHYSTDFYSNVPMQLYARTFNGQEFSTVVQLSGEITVAEITLPNNFVPEVFFLNVDEKISQSVLGQSKVISNLGQNNFTYAEMNFDVNNFGNADSVFVRIENHFAAANDVQSDFFVSPDRWWNVFISGADENSDFSAMVRYYGNENQSNYFDTLFFSMVENLGWNEDSIVLVFRSSPDDLWQEWNDYEVITIPGLTNWNGQILINKVVSGQYAFALRSDVVSVRDDNKNQSVKIFGSGREIVVLTSQKSGQLTIHDQQGRLVFDQFITQDLRIPIQSWTFGVYHVCFKDELNGSAYVVKVVH